MSLGISCSKDKEQRRRMPLVLMLAASCHWGPSAEVLSQIYEMFDLKERGLSFCIFVSVDQILTHQYTEKLLYLRLCFRNAKECVKKGETKVLLKRKQNNTSMNEHTQIDFLFDSPIFGQDIPAFIRVYGCR